MQPKAMKRLKLSNIKVRRAKTRRERKWKNSTAAEDAALEENSHSLAFSDLIGFNEEEEKMRALLKRIGKAKAMLERMKDSKALVDEMEDTRALLLRSLEAVHALNTKIVEHNINVE